MKKYSPKQLKQIEQRIDNLLDFSLSILKNPSLLSSIENNSQLILISEKDIEQAKENIALGLKSADLNKTKPMVLIGKSTLKTSGHFDINAKKEPELVWK